MKRTGTKQRPRKAGQLVVRVDEELIKSLDVHVAYLAEFHDIHVSRAEVARTAIETGLRGLLDSRAPSQKGGVKRPPKKAVRRKG